MMRTTMHVCMLLVALLQAALAYDGYQVLSVTPKRKEHVEALNMISEELGNEVNVWNDRILLNKSINVQASPEKVDALNAYLQHHELKGELIMKDMGQIIRDQVANRKPIVHPLNDFAFDVYHTLEEIENWMKAMVANHSEVAQLITIGHSYTLHPIYAIRVSTQRYAKKPVIWLDAGIHAREWAAHALMLWYIDKFFAEYTTDEVLSKSLETHDWYFMPVFNVDGYEFTWIEDENGTLINRDWRKTRTPNPDQESECYGTDPNRNWDRKWGTTAGISFDPCSDWYCGPTPFSEPCVRHVSYYLREQIDVDIYFAYHTFGQVFMLPYGYTEEKPDDYDYLMEVCERGVSRVKAVHGTDYHCGSLEHFFGLNSGSSADYMYDVVGTKFSFGVELRDTDKYGWLLPPDQIVPCSEENFPFVLQVVEDFMNQPASTTTQSTTTVQSTTGAAPQIVISVMNFISLVAITTYLITYKHV